MLHLVIVIVIIVIIVVVDVMGYFRVLAVIVDPVGLHLSLFPRNAALAHHIPPLPWWLFKSPGVGVPIDPTP